MQSPHGSKLSRRFLTSLFCFALVLRVLYILVAVDNTTIGSWLDAGPNISLNLLEGKGYISSWDIAQNFRSFRTPVWPLTLYGLWTLFGYSVLIPKLFMGLLSAVTCVLVALLGTHLFDARVGRLAGVVVALCTTLIRWTGTLGMETMAVFFITAGVYLVCAPPERFNLVWRTALAGITLGLLCLSRPFWIPFVALVVVAMALSGPTPRLPRAGILMATVALVMLPWVVRNALVHRTLIVGSTDGGLAFMEANNPKSFREKGSWIPGYAATLPDVQRQLPTLSEAQFDRFMYRKGIAYVAADPLNYGRVYLLRLGYLWKPAPPAHMTADLSGKHILLMNVWWGSCYALMVAGFLIYRPWKRPEQWPVLLVLLWASVAIPLFSSQLRYRAPLEPFTLLYGAAGWFALQDWWRQRKSV